MDLARQEYPGLLSSLEPDQAINVLNDRVTLINKINGDIADWLLERRKIEETYAASLRKLARRPQQDSATSLGVFQMPWQRIVSGVENTAQAHENLASKIETDIENPLRQYTSRSRELQSMGNMQGNLAAIAKDIANAQKKADKLNAKGSNKIGDAQSNVEDATAQWSSQAPFVFEQLQALDEGRVNHLRDVLTQLQTHELDQTEKQRASAESCLNALLNVETADEIKTFAVRTKEQRGGVARRRESATDGASRPLSSHVPPAPPPPRSAHPEHRTSSIPQLEKPMPPPEVPQKSKMSGLKRLGTVMGRRKSAAPPPPPSAADKDKKKEKVKDKSRGFAPFRRGDSSRSFQDLEATGSDLTPSASRDGQASSRHELDSVVQDDRRAETSRQTAPVNGIPSQTSPAVSDRAPQLPDPIQPSHIEVGAGQTTGMLSPESALRPETRPEPRPDPFAAAMSDSGVDESTRNLTIRDQPIHEDEGEAQLAMSTMANQLRMQAQNSGINRVQGSVRGRRDVRNTMFVPPQTDILNPSISGEAAATSAGSLGSDTNAASVVTGSGPDLATPVRKSTAATIPEEHGIGSDTQSVHSAHSLAGIAHHPEMHLPGLNASIVETVSTWFSDNNVTRSVVVGEIALAYIPSSGQEAQQETIRVQNFQVLEKCAQNPTFVSPAAASGSVEEQAGTYTVALSSIKRPAPTVALKYQLHMNEKNLGQYSPVLITSAWQIVEGQARVIVLYSLNPAFQLKEGLQEITMKNVTVTVSLDVKSEGAGKPVNAMMSPTQGASFKKRSGSVLWKFSELVVKPTQERLLAGFTIEGGLAQKGGVELKFEMPETSASRIGVERMSVVEADPFADEGERKSAEQQSRWQDVNLKRQLISGKYSSV